MTSSNLFTGLSAFPPTPADAQGHVHDEALSRLLQRIHHAGADSIGLLGSTGSYVYLSRNERRRAVEIAVECVGGKIPIIAGVGALRTDEAKALARDAKQAGADGVLLAPVSYLPLTEEEVYQHFVAVAETTDLPLCIYNNPGTTGFTFSDTLIARLSKITNIAAVKMPLPKERGFKDEIALLREATSEGFSIGYSGDWGAAEAMLSGADAWYSVVAGLLPVPSLRLARAAQAGNVEEARRLDHEFQPLWKLFKEFGSFRVMYLIAGILKIFQAEPPRPLLPIKIADTSQLEDALGKLSG
jgi:4-hydroxy-tetrahydrodipicolinate synthase